MEITYDYDSKPDQPLHDDWYNYYPHGIAEDYENYLDKMADDYCDNIGI